MVGVVRGNLSRQFRSRGRVCLGGKDVHAHIFEYHEAFHRLHRAMPRFSVSWNCAGHEDTMRVTSTYDVDLEASFRRMLHSDLLEDTAVLLISDHGMKGQRTWSRYTCMGAYVTGNSRMARTP